ncbi:MAG: ATP synthase F0 subunit B [Phycisphaeraceae bacterium]|nr:MAG: ATP synthase F0 subunit B [Phycisphaeraceae bacterium]
MSNPGAHIRRAVAGLGALLLCGQALGADPAANQNPLAVELVPYVSTLIVFSVVFFVLARFVWPVVSKALATREQKIRGDIEQAERSRKQAEAALAQYQEALSEARAEAGRILEQAKTEHQQMAAQLRSKTEAELNTLRENAARDIEGAKRAAVSEIYGQMAMVSSAIASKILQREINPGDQQQLVDESLREVEAIHSN